MLAGYMSFIIINPAYGQELTIEQIKNNLLNNPPNAGNPSIREETILALDAILLDDSSRTAQSVFNLYVYDGKGKRRTT